MKRITEPVDAARPSGPLVQYHDVPGPLGRFAGVWTASIGAAYAFSGTEIVGITAAETHNPTKNVPRAIRGVWTRLLLFYIVDIFVLGLICPSNDPNLVTNTGTAASSAWVVATQRARIKVVPHIANACFLSTFSFTLRVSFLTPYRSSLWVVYRFCQLIHLFPCLARSRWE